MTLKTKIDLHLLVKIAQGASKKVMEVFNGSFETKYKEDQSPLTCADLAANDFICNHLFENWPEILIISEENQDVGFRLRAKADNAFLVDPLDGTKEFINKTTDFTVNIGLVSYGEPILGVVVAPALGLTYFGSIDEGAFVYDHNTKKSTSISVNTFSPKDEGLKIVASKSHFSQETKNYIDQFNNPEIFSYGSSLKILRVADSQADIYPRLGPTYEWDTCAAHAILKSAGGHLVDAITNQELKYNKENLLNPHFIAMGDKQ